MEARLGDLFTASWPVLELVVRGTTCKEAESGKQATGTLLMTYEIMRILRKHWDKLRVNYALRGMVCAILVSCDRE